MNNIKEYNTLIKIPIDTELMDMKIKDEKPTLTFHAGALSTKPNTVESVEKAINANAEIIELDVSFDDNRTPVMIHKANPHIGEGVYIYKAFELLKDCENIRLNLDLKSLKGLDELEAVLKKYGLLKRTFYTGVIADWVNTVKENSSVPYWLNHEITESERTEESAAQSAARLCKDLGALGVNCDFMGASKLFCDVMHENGVKVSLWTPDTKEDILTAMDFGADNITTKRPDIFRKLQIKIHP